MTRQCRQARLPPPPYSRHLLIKDGTRHVCQLAFSLVQPIHEHCILVLASPGASTLLSIVSHSSPAAADFPGLSPADAESP
ncbi:unnamed protein product [Periconia digitata]|uniref:Uncharacterized protein n=1 Tax=Periconia digitata TaxID=1303443 RepID=A0A9W4U4E3_9PLEO|nr:unnamed protein product [Periconia digitata]